MGLKSHCGSLLVFDPQVNDVNACGLLPLRLLRVGGKSLFHGSLDLTVQNSKTSQMPSCPAFTGNDGIIINHSEIRALFLADVH